MAASSSSTALVRGNLRSRAANWQQFPLSRIDAPHISDEFGAPIEDRRLLALARALAVVDNDVIQSVKLMYTRVRDGNLNLPEEQAATIQDGLAEMDIIIRQFNDIRDGHHGLGAAYLKERRFVFYWQKYYSLVGQLLDVDFPGTEHDLSSTIQALKWHQKMVAKLPDAIQEAASYGCLDDQQELLLEERWVRLDQMNEAYQSKIPDPIALPNWKELSGQIANARSSQKTKTSHGGLKLQSALIWLVFLNTVSNTSTFGLTYYYSSHTAGTTRDADFWSLVQQVVTQLVGLCITCVPLTRSDITRLPWVLPAIGVFALSIASIPLYLYTPTEWSSFSMLAAGAVQTFLTLQLAILVG